MTTRNGRIYFKVKDIDTNKWVSLSKKISDYESEQHCIDDVKRIREYHKRRNNELKKKKYENLFVPIELNKFEIETDIDLKLDKNTGNTTILFGSSKQGKTTTMLYIMNKYYKKSINTLFSVNAHDPRFNEIYLKSDQFNTKSTKYIKLQKYINSKVENYYDFTLFFDDIVDCKHKNIINDLIMTYRNSNISTVMCLQYGFLLSKMNRANINNILIFGMNSVEASEDIIKLFLSKYFDRLGIKDHYGFYKKITANHGFIYIHNATDTISFHRLEKL